MLAPWHLLPLDLPFNDIARCSTRFLLIRLFLRRRCLSLREVSVMPRFQGLCVFPDRHKDRLLKKMNVRSAETSFHQKDPEAMRRREKGMWKSALLVTLLAAKATTIETQPLLPPQCLRRIFLLQRRHPLPRRQYHHLRTRTLRAANARVHLQLRVRSLTHQGGGQRVIEC